MAEEGRRRNRAERTGRRVDARQRGERAAQPAPGSARCAECGARVSTPDARACEFCGRALFVEPPPVPSARDIAARRIARVRAHPQFERVCRQEPPVGAQMTVLVMPMFVGVMFVVLPAAMQVKVSDGPGAPGPMFSVALGLCALVGVAVVVFCGVRAAAFLRAPTRAVAVRVSGLRSTHARESSTQYFATLEDEQGRRREFRTTGDIAGLLAEDDVGVAFVRAGCLLGFRPLRI